MSNNDMMLRIRAESNLNLPFNIIVNTDAANRNLKLSLSLGRKLSCAFLAPLAGYRRLSSALGDSPVL